MPQSDPSPDRSSLLAFIAFGAAATIWIGVMAIHPNPASLHASAIVISRDIIAMARPAPTLMELADLSR